MTKCKCQDSPKWCDACLGRLAVQARALVQSAGETPYDPKWNAQYQDDPNAKQPGAVSAGPTAGSADPKWNSRTIHNLRDPRDPISGGAGMPSPLPPPLAPGGGKPTYGMSIPMPKDPRYLVLSGRTYYSIEYLLEKAEAESSGARFMVERFLRKLAP